MAMRQSPEHSMMLFIDPAVMESQAESKAVVAPLIEPVKSAVRMSERRSRAVAITPPACLSVNGEVVVAKYRPSTFSRSMPVKQSTAAFTDMLTLSSSQLDTAFSPGKRLAGFSHVPIAP